MTSSLTVITRRGLQRVLALALFLFIPASTHAQEYPIFGGAGTLVWKTQLVIGAGIRAGTPQPVLVGAGSGAEFPGAGGAVGVNDDAQLNFPNAGDVFSAPLTLNSEMSLAFKHNQGAFIRIRGWYDMRLQALDAPHGNGPGAFEANSRLSDANLLGAAKFEGLDIYDAYYFANFRAGKAPVMLRIGRQAVDWGEGLFYPGINAFNPLDVAWVTTVGARMANGGKLPVNRVYGNVALPGGLVVDGFFNLEFRPSVFAACGTYFSNLDNGQHPGCNALTTAGLPDGASLALLGSKNFYQGTLSPNGRFPEGATDTRPMTGEPSRYSGWGVAARQFVEPIKTEIGFYYTGYTSPTFVNASVLGASGLDYSINTMYPTGVTSWAVSASSGLRNVALSTQLTRTLDFPAHYNAPGYITGSIQGVGPFGFMKRECAALGECQTYFPLNTTQLQYGATWQFGRLIGLSDATIIAEADMQWNTNMPPVDGPGAIRLGRYGNFGDADWTNNEGYVCNPGPLSNGIVNQCAIDGFVTPYSMGYKVRAATSFPQVGPGLVFTPALTIGHDLTGFSADQYTIVGGRFTFAANLRMDIRQRSFLELGMLRYRSGAKWDPNADRGQYTVVYGVNLR